MGGVTAPGKDSRSAAHPCRRICKHRSGDNMGISYCSLCRVCFRGHIRNYGISCPGFGRSSFVIRRSDISMSVTPITGEHATTQIGTTIPAGYHTICDHNLELAAGSNFGSRRPTATTKKNMQQPITILPLRLPTIALLDRQNIQPAAVGSRQLQLQTVDGRLVAYHCMIDAALGIVRGQL